MKLILLHLLVLQYVRNCYQVSEDVAIEFMKVYSAEETELILTPDDNNKCTGKYHLDLIAANYINLINAVTSPTQYICS